jgi:urease accessory protein
MGRFDVLLTAVLTGPLMSEGAAAILDDLSRRGVAANADFIVSASRMTDGGTLLRMAGVSVEQVGSALRDSLRCLYPLLGDDPWRRKW